MSNSPAITGVKMEETSDNENAKDLEIIQLTIKQKIERLEAELREQRSLHFEVTSSIESKLRGKQDENHLDVQVFANDNTNIDHHEMNKKSKEDEKNNGPEDYHHHSLDSTPMTKAWRNPLILMKILGKMRPLDLLELRLVNKEWNQYSTEILLRQRKIQISFENDTSFDGSFQEFLSRKSSSKMVLAKNSNLTLKQLTAFLTTSKEEKFPFPFPCVSFSFKRKLDCPDTQEFLNEHGKQIQELKLEEHMNSADLRKLLQIQVPNLQSLRLKSFGLTDKEEDEDSDDSDDSDEELAKVGKLFPVTENDDGNSPQLSSLKSLEILNDYCSAPLIREIMKAAPNLNRFPGVWPISRANVLLSQGHELKNLKLQQNGLNIYRVRRISEKNLKLECLTVDCNFTTDYQYLKISPELRQKILSAFEEYLVKILSSSRLTLEQIRWILYDQKGNQVKVDWKKAELENVWKLTVSIDFQKMLRKEGDYSYFHLGENNSSFPALHTVVLDETRDNHSTHRCSSSRVGFVFPFDGQASSVKSLHVSGFFQITMATTIFPDVTNLVLTKVENFSEVSSALWKMTGLERLELELKPTKLNTLVAVDQAFTGFEKQTCEFLQGSGRNMKLEKIQLDKLRVKSSLLDLKNLREFCLWNKFQENVSFPNYDGSIYGGVSSLSKEFAIDMHPNLLFFY